MGHKAWKLLEVSYHYPRKSADKIDNSQVFMALNRLTLTQDYGGITGVIGGKGAGKSTLGKILLEELYPSEGLIVGTTESRRALRLPSRHYDDRTGERYVRHQLAKEGISRKRIPQLLEAIHEFSELGNQLHRKLKHITKEEKIQLEVSILLHVNASFIYIDEQLLTVKEHFYLKVFLRLLKLKERGASIWVETDSIKRIEKYCDTLVWLEFGRLQKYGHITEVLLMYDAYYYEIQRLSLEQQHAFWEMGYQEQWRLSGENGVTEHRKVGNSEKKIELDNQMNRSQRHKKPATRPFYLKAIIIVLIGLVLGVALLVRDQVIKEQFHSILPNTQNSKPSDSTEMSSVSFSNISEPETSSDADSAETYLVKEGDDLPQIASQFGLSVEQLQEWNQLEVDELSPGTRLIIKQPEIDSSSQLADFTHLVKPGETLDIIAEKYGVSLEALESVNQLEDMTIYSGTVLSLPVTAKAEAQEEQ